MKYFLYMLLVSVVFGCSANTQSTSEIEKTQLGRDCVFKVQEDMKCSLSMNDDVVNFDIKIKELNDYEWTIDSIYVKSKNIEEGFSIKGSDDVIMRIGDTMVIESPDINFDGIRDIAMSTSFISMSNFYYDYWLVDKERRFKFIGNYPHFRLDKESNKVKTKVKISAAEYEQEIYHWEGDKLVSDKKISIGPDNISELW